MAIKKLFFLFSILLSMVGTKASAYDIAVENADGATIYYNFIKNGTEVEVTSRKNNTYSGDVVIPEEITYENKTRKVTSIGEVAFYRCSDLTSVTIPNSVTNIRVSAFDNSNLQEIISKIEDPFDIGTSVFSNNTFSNAKLYVPTGTIDKYTATEGWKKFVNIKEGDPSGITNVETERAKEIRRYTLNGRSVKDSHKSVNIIQMDNGTTKKVLVK